MPSSSSKVSSAAAAAKGFLVRAYREFMTFSRFSRVTSSDLLVDTTRYAPVSMFFRISFWMALCSLPASFP